MELTADWTTWQWALLGLAALTVGVSKTGFGGIGLIAVYLMAVLFGKDSVGILLPMLVVADVTVYPLFRRYASWGPVWKLMPPMLVGLVLGYVMLDRIPEEVAPRVIGGIILLMVGIQLFRRYATEWFDKMAESRGFGLGAGVAGGDLDDDGQCGGAGDSAVPVVATVREDGLDRGRGAVVPVGEHPEAAVHERAEDDHAGDAVAERDDRAVDSDRGVFWSATGADGVAAGL